MSGYTWIEWDETENKWVEIGQQCRYCSRLVYPSSVWPLQYMGSDGTPVNSDEEATDDFLSGKLKDLTIKQFDTLHLSS